MALSKGKAARFEPCPFCGAKRGLYVAWQGNESACAPGQEADPPGCPCVRFEGDGHDELKKALA